MAAHWPGFSNLPELAAMYYFQIAATLISLVAAALALIATMAGPKRRTGPDPETQSTPEPPAAAPVEASPVEAPAVEAPVAPPPRDARPEPQPASSPVPRSPATGLPMASTPLERMASAHQAIRQGMDTITSACADLSARQHHQDSAFDQAAQAVDGCLDLARSAAQSASRMGGLVALIDDIAFQTNLVALNAGVEASRAGESGQGFALVAAQARDLARRCAEGAREAKAMALNDPDQIAAILALTDKAAAALQTARNHSESLPLPHGQVMGPGLAMKQGWPLPGLDACLAPFAPLVAPSPAGLQ
ncbi:MAG: methyl-accepting chemotaxis protein [Novosphingobium aromaticivorans]|nr:methyl-accepting chemotaxis protein [Novosphingobium aromaticivorans]